jgi:DNA mismatch endonuclease (patch repair protein)
MPDTFTKSERSLIMAAVKSKNTAPELLVRRLVHSLGFRFRLHVKSLPGTPDLVFPRLKKIILVSGCFWHMHDCPRCRIPATRRAFWLAKLNRNRLRDQRTRKALQKAGYRVLTLYECQLRRPSLPARIHRFLSQTPSPRAQPGGRRV